MKYYDFSEWGSLILLSNKGARWRLWDQVHSGSQARRHTRTRTEVASFYSKLRRRRQKWIVSIWEGRRRRARKMFNSTQGHQEDWEFSPLPLSQAWEIRRAVHFCDRVFQRGSSWVPGSEWARKCSQTGSRLPPENGAESRSQKLLHLKLNWNTYWRPGEAKSKRISSLFSSRGRTPDSETRWTR